MVSSLYLVRLLRDVVENFLFIASFHPTVHLSSPLLCLPIRRLLHKLHDIERNACSILLSICIYQHHNDLRRRVETRRESAFAGGPSRNRTQRKEGDTCLSELDKHSKSKTNQITNRANPTITKS